MDLWRAWPKQSSNDSKEVDILYFYSERARSSAYKRTLCNATWFWYHTVHTLGHAKLVKHQKLLLNEQHGTFPSWLCVGSLSFRVRSSNLKSLSRPSWRKCGCITCYCAYVSTTQKCKNLRVLESISLKVKWNSFLRTQTSRHSQVPSKAVPWKPDSQRTHSGARQDFPLPPLKKLPIKNKKIMKTMS